ncbi:hypothetical protein CRE_20389 [Caenorhabditis remanei]|uniref:Uncharacterized protein n=1 Tax=Caenorhabditis remanei TaxID=31234 RepID=E3MD34_CAERE|nr:hypothetical protein CRE_20389 [Caenorhabditis remanei]
MTKNRDMVCSDSENDDSQHSSSFLQQISKDDPSLISTSTVPSKVHQSSKTQKTTGLIQRSHSEPNQASSPSHSASLDFHSQPTIQCDRKRSKNNGLSPSKLPIPSASKIKIFRLTKRPTGTPKQRTQRKRKSMKLGDYHGNNDGIMYSKVLKLAPELRRDYELERDVGRNVGEKAAKKRADDLEKKYFPST